MSSEYSDLAQSIAPSSLLAEGPDMRAVDTEGLTGDIAIRVQDLSKCYQIYDKPHDRLKQSLYPRLQSLIGMPAKQYHREFWALKNVSFEVKRGDTVGIIGRNGSGKSTLLQLICGTLAATSGTIETTGRIAALLELGAGFNPEFTGRENVYMSGEILGLSKEEIDDRFDNIASFADIGEFIEQPVKIYSSGMYVRLAFAVIAHVDADILIIDEALAVGDAVFTQKCMRYIRDFQKRGTLLFVSHDMGSVQNLCKTGVWLSHGMTQMIGTSKDVSEAYLQYTLQETYGKDAKLNAIKSNTKAKAAESDTTLHDKTIAAPLIDYGAKLIAQENIADATGWQTGVADLISIQLARLDGGIEEAFSGGEQVRVTVRAKANQELAQPIIGFVVRDRLGQELFGENTLPFTDITPVPVKAGQEFFAEFVFRLPMLPNGQYAVMASVAGGSLYNNIQHHFLHDALILTVTSSRIRWGLVGISFEKVTLKIANE
jgi:lipopolysaccharide transport system ATP-binding protein